MRKSINYKVIRIISIIVLSLLCSNVAIDVIAEETANNVVLSSMMVATDTIEVRTEASENADVLVIFKEGDNIFVTGKTEDGWYIVSYQGKTGYFGGNGKNVPIVENAAFTDTTALDQEMETEKTESLFLGEEIIHYQSSKRMAVVWTVIIIAALAGVFVAAFISSKKRKATENGEKEADTGELVTENNEDVKAEIESVESCEDVVVEVSIEESNSSEIAGENNEPEENEADGSELEILDLDDI